MDIVSRLKEFSQHLDLSVTQFADMCKVPRPTMSQLFNGRNKKVSDELIRKIHTEFPNLNVMWLLFGEGEMLADDKNETSEPQKPSLFDFVEGETTVKETANPTLDFGISDIGKTPKKFDKADVTSAGAFGGNSATKEEEYAQRDSGIHTLQSALESERTKQPTISFSEEGERRIVNIIVYYSDNSFESFVPGQATD